MRQTDPITWKGRWVRWCLLVSIAAVSASSAHSRLIAAAQQGEPKPDKSNVSPQERSLSITASFAEKELVRPDERIELELSRELKEAEGRVAVFVGTTDVTSLFTAIASEKLLRYNAKLWPLPLGESVVTVYLVSKDDEWKEVAQFNLRVAKEKAGVSQQRLDASAREESELTVNANFLRGRLSGFEAPRRVTKNGAFDPALGSELTTADEEAQGQQQSASSSQSSSSPGDKPAATAKKNKLKFTPALTLTIPSQPAQSTFPGPQPERATFIELNMQASLKSEATYGIVSAQSSFDFAGSSFEKEALRFGTDGNAAPKVDLSSYLIQVQTGKVKYQVGHFSYGTQRQLINSFSSRGIEITVPFLRRFDFSVAAMNGTQLVGYTNFFGLSNTKHEMLSGTLGIEFLPKRPGGLRMEVGVLSAYVQPISGVNRGVVTDLQRSRGIALRLIASDKGGGFISKAV